MYFLIHTILVLATLEPAQPAHINLKVMGNPEEITIKLGNTKIPTGNLETQPIRYQRVKLTAVFIKDGWVQQMEIWLELRGGYEYNVLIKINPIGLDMICGKENKGAFHEA